MKRFAIALLLIVATATQVKADWRVYREGKNIIASYDYLSFAPFQNQPSVWVKWQNVSKKAKLGGRKIQFTADCAKHRLFEINSIPFDRSGNFLEEHRLYKSPKEYPLKHNGLYKATFGLLCE
jgi:hypothetical protein